MSGSVPCAAPYQTIPMTCSRSRPGTSEAVLGGDHADQKSSAAWLAAPAPVPVGRRREIRAIGGTSVTYEGGPES